MFETFLLLCVRETIEKKLAERTYYKDENRLFWTVHKKYSGNFVDRRVA